MCYYGVVVCLLFMFSVNVSRLKSGLISALLKLMSPLFLNIDIWGWGGDNIHG